MKIEEWRPVVGFEGSYEVSDHGRVRSLDRVQVWRRTIHGIFIETERRFAGKILKPSAKAAGHLWVTLGKGSRLYVHHLVLKAFVGLAPIGTECLHWDDNPANNGLDNLRWGTRAENIADFVRNYGCSPRHVRHA